MCSTDVVQDACEYMIERSAGVFELRNGRSWSGPAVAPSIWSNGRWPNACAHGGHEYQSWESSAVEK